MTEPFEIAKMKVARLRPGDLVVVSCKNRLTIEAMVSLRQRILEVLPEGVKAAVLDGDVSWEVYRPVAQRRPPTSPDQATPSASPRELGRAADSVANRKRP